MDDFAFRQRFSGLAAESKWKFMDDHPIWLTQLEPFHSSPHRPLKELVVTTRCPHDDKISRPIVVGRIEHCWLGIHLEHVQLASRIHAHVVPSVTFDIECSIEVFAHFLDSLGNVRVLDRHNLQQITVVELDAPVLEGIVFIDEQKLNWLVGVGIGEIVTIIDQEASEFTTFNELLHQGAVVFFHHSFNLDFKLLLVCDPRVPRHIPATRTIEVLDDRLKLW